MHAAGLPGVMQLHMFLDTSSPCCHACQRPFAFVCDEETPIGFRRTLLKVDVHCEQCLLSCMVTTSLHEAVVL